MDGFSGDSEEQTQRQEKKQKSHIQVDTSGGKMQDGFLQVLGPNQRRLSTEGGNFAALR